MPTGRYAGFCLEDCPSAAAIPLGQGLLPCLGQPTRGGGEDWAGCECFATSGICGCHPRACLPSAKAADPGDPVSSKRWSWRIAGWSGPSEPSGRARGQARTQQARPWQSGLIVSARQGSPPRRRCTRQLSNKECTHQTSSYVLMELTTRLMFHVKHSPAKSRWDDFASRPVSRVLFGGLPLRDGHSSGARIAPCLEQPTRAAARIALDARACARATVPPLFGLAPGGVCRAVCVAAHAVRSYRTVSPLPLRVAPLGRSVLCGTFPGVAPGGR